jgi:glyoxylase-like metal-dependent hydrolase (beta-lactamase superfamily II)
MELTIHPIALGVTNCYIIRHEGMLLVDSGVPKKAGSFKKALDKLNISSDEIQLILITHAHWDHIGSAKEIKKLTGAKVIYPAHGKPFSAEVIKKTLSQ